MGARECPRALGPFAVDGEHTFSCGGSGEVISSWTANASAVNAAAMEASCKDEGECTVTLAFGESGGSVMAVCESVDFDVFTIVSILFIFTVMMAMGATLSLDEFRRVLREQKKGVAVGWCCQFGIMPLLSYICAKAAGFDTLTATGLILCGCAPGGSTSNLFTYWAKGDLALSITMSTCSTAAAIAMYPLLIFIYITTLLGATGEDVAIPFSNIVISLFLIVVPASIGMLAASKCPGAARHIERVGSALGGVFLALSCYSGISDHSDLIDVGKYTGLWVVAALFEPVGAAAGFGIATLLGMDDASRVAIALETGVQNFALVLALVSLSFTGCARTETLGFILLGMFFYVVNSFWLCAAFRYWRNSREHSSAAAPDRQATAAAEEEAKGGGDTAVAAAKVGGVADANNP